MDIFLQSTYIIIQLVFWCIWGSVGYRIGKMTSERAAWVGMFIGVGFALPGVIVFWIVMFMLEKRKQKNKM